MAALEVGTSGGGGSLSSTPQDSLMLQDLRLGPSAIPNVRVPPVNFDPVFTGKHVEPSLSPPDADGIDPLHVEGFTYTEPSLLLQYKSTMSSEQH